MNNVQLEGNLARDIEISFSKNGMAVARGTVACNRRIKDGETRYSSNVIATGAGTALFPYKKKSEDGIPASQGNGFEDLGTPVDEELPF